MYTPTLVQNTLDFKKSWSFFIFIISLVYSVQRNLDISTRRSSVFLDYPDFFSSPNFVMNIY